MANSKLKRKQIIRRLRREYGQTGNTEERDHILAEIAIVRLLPENSSEIK
ncbi:hypothetical protein LCGC14_0946130 [marine sediment metagenome]|uniref:Uncharacterized protein n=1 Tax=marine sediment metagenome TaxID=412755 RepID=A0A0F9P4S1_9ZZZZ